jgi:ribonucleotide monophosphatase NagD (HAD superfamily)
MISAIRDKLLHDEKDYLILGDRLETDISIGNKMGMDTAFVKSGVNNKTRNSTYNITYTVF